MDALLMCGGRGTRLAADVEKPLFEVAGVPTVERVRRALASSRVERVHAVVSPHVPETATRLRERAEADPSLHLIETPGEGYVEDLGVALECVEPPVLTVVADLPLLAPGHVDRAVTEQRREGGSLTVCVPTALAEALGVSVDTTRAHGGRDLCPTGLNVVDGPAETVTVTWDARLAVNVNRTSDAAVAESLADGPDAGVQARGP